MAALLSVSNLTIAFGGTPVVEDMSFTLDPGEVLGIVGESGSGKSMTALALLRLIPPPGRVTHGRIEFDGIDVLAQPEAAMQDLRGRAMSMIFQEPMTSLNPVFTIGEQIEETLRVHERLDRAATRRRAVELLELVEIPAAARRLGDYPHQLSGGMRQRVMIAIALACRPKVLIADEPTTALDVTIQAQILDLLRGLRKELGMAVILITHDLGVVAEFADRVMVMYAGRVVENAPAAALFATPRHPYAEGLLASIPRLDGPIQRLNAITGMVPSPHAMPPGCRFAPRCPHARDACAERIPATTDLGGGRSVACIRETGYRQTEAVS
ncbi:MAG: ABC transporter ATP-binding protein [Alphaproteobacteria bacterium]|nr:ABC transporter ATP-binding protein [Alphaproteobacteria bacterium]